MLVKLVRALLGAVLLQSVVGSTEGTSCTQPTVRKEWRSLSNAQKEAWIKAVNCLAKLPSSGKLNPTVNPTDPGNSIPPVNKSSTWYDDFSYVHMDLNSHIHQTGLFLPWHRYYVWSYEQSLKKLCGYTGFSPYWDWSIDAPDFSHGTIFADSSPLTGLGGFGLPTKDWSVPTGGFAHLELAYPIPHTLRREYTPFPFIGLPPPLFTNPNVSAASTFTRAEVHKMVNGFVGDYKGFQTYFEWPEGAHTSVHLIMGGDLGGSCPQGSPSTCVPGPKWSPNDPLFWLHHAMVDKVWYDWQHANSNNLHAFEAGTIQDFATWPQYTNGAPPAMTLAFPLPTDGILTGNYTVGDVLETTKGPLCYVYDS